jgi:type IV pilus assembly protein PilA
VDKKSGFTLVEVMIVVAILGILAAIVMPQVQGYTQKAKEAAAKDNLRILREAIERYAAEHNDVPPGYPNDDPTQTPTAMRFSIQMAKNQDYLSEMPKNPFNGSIFVACYTDDRSLSEVATGFFGYLYKPATKEIRLDSTEVDSEGIHHYDY